MSSLLTSCAPFPCQSGLITGVSCQVLTCHNTRNPVLMLLVVVDGESHQAKLVSCHVVLYRCLARSHRVTSCLTMSRLRLEFVTGRRSATQVSRYPWRERHSKLNSTVLSWHRATLTQNIPATHLCWTSWCAVPSRLKEASHCEKNHNCNSSHQIAFASIFRNTRTRPQRTS